MTKVLRLNVVYYGNYGGDVDETLLLPLDVNGVLFSNLETGVTLDKRVSLGEIEGKHSECYGDLTIDVVNLDELDSKKASQLVKYSNFEKFENFFEDMEIDYHEHLENEEKDLINKLLDKYEVDRNSYGILTNKVYNKFIEELESKYVIRFKEVSVNEADYEKVIKILKSKGIQTF